MVSTVKGADPCLSSSLYHARIIVGFAISDSTKEILSFESNIHHVLPGLIARIYYEGFIDMSDPLSAAKRVFLLPSPMDI